MADQLSVAVRNARLDAIETTIGTARTLEIRTGAQPVTIIAFTITHENGYHGQNT